MLRNKTNLNKFERIETTSTCFSDSRTWEFNSIRNKNGKKTNMRVKHAARKPKDQLRNPRENQKIPQDKWKWKHNLAKPMECSKKQKEAYSNIGLPQD